MRTDIRNKELSWLSFNERLLQEAEDLTVPLLERIKFLGIFSNNLDEFFRVRVATLKRIEKLGKKAVTIMGNAPQDVLHEIHKNVLSMQARFEHIYQNIQHELAQHHIYIINEKELDVQQAEFVRNFFRFEVRGVITPLMIDQLVNFPELDDHAIYLAVRMWKSNDPESENHALIEVPTATLSRFVILPQVGEKQCIILLDDVIRFNLDAIFAIFKYDRFDAFTIKLTRDAEIDLDDDLSESLLKKISKGISKRKSGTPVRFIFDHEIPGKFLKYLIQQIHPDQVNSNFIPGSRYHNFKDFLGFPKIGPASLQYEPRAPLPHPNLDNHESILAAIAKQDILLSYPYQTFVHVIYFLREAAIDPHVRSVHITIYRLAGKSKVVNALINAAKNGKEVTVVMELKARFDEEANIYWAKVLRDENIRVIFSPPKFKVHGKLILVTRKIGDKITRYVNIGTGNFNESTAKLYTDHALLSADPRLTGEVQKVFEALEINFVQTSFRHLLVAPFNMRKRWEKLIQNEISNAKKGKPAYIIAKLNNLTDPKIIKKLYKASQAGVVIRLMIRGMFSVVPGVPEMSENIAATGTIDRYLEHTRIFLFADGGKEQIFLSSADWMPRNLDSRVEVACPVYDKNIRAELRDYLEIHWRGNVKARVLDAKLKNEYSRQDEICKVRAQEVLHEYYRLILENNGKRPKLSDLLPRIADCNTNGTLPNVKNFNDLSIETVEANHEKD